MQGSSSGRRRPTPWQWLRYSLGGGLPEDLAEWVLHDTTCRTWALRQVARSLLVISPLIVVLLVFVPGPFWIRALSALGGMLMSLIYSLGYLVETAEHRLVKAGYPAGTGAAVRQGQAGDQRSAATARRREKMFQRMENRRR
ncbi:MAG TPA: DUF5313 family protein [Jatrophihabitans sp.]|jgi:hypothetical protein|uniref:DUF5313 family protein n=1 Tax=Jatrophihabitans sp. TaxID=1932789 RepID=UPI002F11A0F9